MQEVQEYDTSLAGDGIFLLCVPTGWDAYISLEFYELQQGLVGCGWTKLVIDEVEDAVIIAAISRARVVLLWEAYELLERNAAILCDNPRAAKVKRVIFCDDVHFFTQHRREQRLRAFEWADLILATYPDKLQEWFPEVEQHKIRWTPHSAASYFNTDVFAPSSDRILLSGSRTWPYPFRQFCQAKLPESVCHVVDHPGYPGYPGDRMNNMRADTSALMHLGGKHYADLLRSHPAMIVCGSIFGYLVAKVFEGMAAGCLTICERASLGRRLTALGFIEGVHYIGTDFQTAISDSIAIRDALLGGDQRITDIITAAHIRSAEHTTAARAVQIHHVCMEDVVI
ncbi:hypothetical protein [Enterococcus gallinarum]|uniref:hypothetical protein n=1 Tax=Aeromonas dhakensis TaxID=196024 RepID=UPI00038FFA63|nr:Uncharacterised protein [Aeromonas hydrophila]